MNCSLSLSLPSYNLQSWHLYTGDPGANEANLKGGFLTTYCDSQSKATIYQPPTCASIYLDVDPRTDTRAQTVYKDGPPFLSSVCKFSPCVQSIRSSYKQSNQATEAPYKEEILKTWLLDPYDLTELQPPRVELPIAPEYGLNNQTFSADRGILDGIHWFFGTAVTGSHYWDPLNADYSSSYKEMYGSEVIVTLWNANYTGHNCTSQNRVSCGLELVSKGISKAVRDQPWIKNGTRGTAGEAYSLVIFVEVSWYWISLPAFVWFLALFTFLITAWKSRMSVHAWRNSPLPLVFMKLEDEEQVPGGISYKALNERAEQYRGRLKARLGDIRFVNDVTRTGSESE
jgi:hypothetical protein